MNLRTVKAENGYIAVQCPGMVVAGVQCWQTIGSMRHVPPPGHGCYTAFDPGGKVIGMFLNPVDALEAIAFAPQWKIT